MAAPLTFQMPFEIIAPVFDGCPGSPELLLAKSIRIDYACYAKCYGIPFLKQGRGGLHPF
jgi:hypothetical protein